MPVLSTLASIHRAVAAGFIALALVEFFFAGLVAFDATTSYAHNDLGSVLMAMSAVLAVLAVIDRPEAREASIALPFAMLALVLLGAFADEVRVLGGLHGLLSLGVLYVAHQAMQGLPVFRR
jgi:hypothetical protein